MGVGAVGIGSGWMGDEQLLEILAADVVECRACPRLVDWRERVGREKTARFADQVYWGRPVPGFGDARARVLILGLAPAAHGGNRTGRIFTGDRSGDFLFASMYRAGFANQPISIARGDGLVLSGAYVSAVNRCAPPGNRPTPGERDRCLPYLEREVTALSELRVVIALGSFAWDGALRATAGLGHTVRPRPRFTSARTVTTACRCRNRMSIRATSASGSGTYGPKCWCESSVATPPNWSRNHATC